MGKKRDASKTESLVQCVIDAILEKKAKDVTSLEIGKLPNAVSDYFIICHADSTTQVNAIADNIELRVRKDLDSKVWRTAGYDNSVWIVLDFIDVVVHVFQTEMRSFYKLEELWADAEVKFYNDEPEAIVPKPKARTKKLSK
ncbi:MAG: ribosome silencing factor [Tenuifilaceae bacterium]